MLKRFLDSMVAAACEITKAIDDIAIAMRTPLKGMAWFGMAFQGAIAAGTIKFSDGSHWPNAIGAANIFLAYFTIRGVEGQALNRAAERSAEGPQ